jgi:sulfatase maturation enzyme AslB (radical SAM superfamily)
MYCPRLDHFVRFNPSGTVSRCGHMVNSHEFDSLHCMDNSHWLQDIKQQFAQDQFPSECVRCQQTEHINQTSIRLNSLEYHTLQKQDDYLIVGGVLDNTCNSACQSCDANLSTKIGGLISRNYTIIDNSNKFWKLPLERITHLDINGGEPSASKNYRYLLQNIPANVKSIRINTNCSIIIKEIPDLIANGIHVTVTVSFDGIGKMHDYVRWPIKWDNFYKNLMIYKNMKLSNLNLWTTVHALNVGNLHDIIDFARSHQIDHSYALLHEPSVLNISHTNNLTLAAKNNIALDQIATGQNNNNELLQYITQQDKLRKISYIDYLGDIL